MCKKVVLKEILLQLSLQMAKHLQYPYQKNVNLYQKAKIFSICVHSSEITGSTNIKLGVIDYHSVVGVIGNR